MKKTITIFTIIISLSVFSQDGKIFFETNYNTFSHSKLSKFQKELAADIPDIPIQITDNFPANVGFTLGYEIVDSQTAFFLSYNSTGGKISYSDYSGVISIEEPVSALTIGGIYHIPLNDSFRLGLKGLIMISSFEIDTYSKVNGIETRENVGFSSGDIGVGLSFIYEYPISFFIFRANLGFDLVLGNQLNFDDIEEAHLIDNSGDNVTTGWTGLRTGIGIAIPIEY